MPRFNAKAIKKDDIQAMHRLRSEGYTNKQIANSLGICVSTVYAHIGRMSQEVKYAEVQNKPCPVKKEFKFDSSTLMVVHDVDIPKPDEQIEEPKHAEPIEEPKPVITDTPVETENVKEDNTVMETKSLLQILSTRMVLKGSLCNFTVDSESGTIEMSDGIMSGILDRDTIDRFISELSEARKYVVKEDTK